MKRITLLFLLVVAPLSLGQKFSLGKCRQQQSITLTNGIAWIDGVFRVYAVSPSPFFHHWSCVTATITTITGNTAYRIVVQGRDKITRGQKMASGGIRVNGPIAANSAPETSFTFSFRNGRKFISATYYLVDGLADNYLALYACENIGLGKLEHVMILTTPATTPAQITSALTAISEKGYPEHGIKRTYVSCDAL